MPKGPKRLGRNKGRGHEPVLTGGQMGGKGGAGKEAIKGETMLTNG